MPDLTLIAVVAGALLLGVLCTLLVQWAAAVRALAREATETSRQVSELVKSLQPAARRVSRLSGMVEESEPDLRRAQLALRQFCESSLQISESVARVSGWVAFGTPLVMSAIERWAHPHGEPREGPSEAPSDFAGEARQDGGAPERAEAAVREERGGARPVVPMA